MMVVYICCMDYVAFDLDVELGQAAAAAAAAAAG